MATLFNTKISQTYEGLLKTIDNAAISATLRELTDGSGNQSGLYLNTAGDFKVSAILEWGSLKDTGTGVTITRFVTSTDGIENFDNNTSLPTSAAVKLYVDTKFSQTDTLTEVLGFGNTTSGKDIAVSAGDDITFTDSSKILMGAGSDLQIYHDGNNSYVNDTGSGSLILKSNFLMIQSSIGENMINANENGNVNLYFDNALKFQTTNTGISVTGVISNVTNPVDAQDAATKSYVDALDAGSNLIITNAITNGSVNLNTQALAILGTTNEIETAVSGQGVTIGLPTSISTNLVGDVTGNVTGNVTGDLTGTASLIDINNTAANQNQYVLQARGESGSQTVYADAGLLFNPSTNFLTVDGSGTFTGDLNVTGNITGGGGSFLPLAGGTMTGDTIHNDNVKSIYGTASDGLEIYHSGTDSFIKDSGTGNLLVYSNEFRVLNSAGNEIQIRSSENANVALYFNGVEKFYTSNTGIQVLGNGAFTGNVSVPDSAFLYAGTSDDLSLTHNGTDSIIRNYTGDFFVEQAAVTQSIIFKVSDANALDTTALTISRNGDLTTGRDVTIAGDLTVNGTTTTVNSQTLAVVDPLIQLAKDNTANSLDIGLYGDYNDGTGRYLGLFSDASDGNKFKLFKGTTVEPTTTVNIGGAGYVAADLQVAGFEATTGTFSGTTTFYDHSLHPDQVKSKFGNGGDLQIYHDGSNSYIEDTGTGNLYVRAATSFIAQGINQSNFIIANQGGGVNLYYNNANKFDTTSTGINVTGGITVNDTLNSVLELNTSNANCDITMQSVNTSSLTRLRNGTNDFQVHTNGTLGLTIDSSQNSTFAGGVAFSGGVVRLISNQLQSGFNQDSDNTDFWINYQGYQGGTTYFRDFRIGDGKQNQIAFFDGSTKNTTFAGNVGIGTSSPDFDLDIERTATTVNDDPTIRVRNAWATQGNNTGFSNRAAGLYSAGADTVVTKIQSRFDTGFNLGEVGTTTNHDFRFITNNVERMRIDSSGNVGIGTDSPSTKLHLGGATNTALTISKTGDLSTGLQIGRDSGTLASYIIQRENADLFIRTNNIERMRITSSGRVSMGSDTTIANANNLTLTNASSAEIDINCTGGHSYRLASDTSDSFIITDKTVNTERMRITSAGGLTVGGQTSTRLVTTITENDKVDLKVIDGTDSGRNFTFSTGNTERMRITSGGNVLIGTESTTVGGVAGHKLVIDATSQNLGIKTASGSNQAVRFANGSTAVGSINLTTSSTSFNTSSDYRLKEDLQDFAGLDMVSKIPVYDFKWKTDESRSYGVMAHELHEVLPDAVSGEKDAEEMQGVDYSKIVPLLVKSIQELKAEIDILKSQNCKCKI